MRIAHFADPKGKDGSSNASAAPTVGWVGTLFPVGVNRTICALATDVVQRLIVAYALQSCIIPIRIPSAGGGHADFAGAGHEDTVGVVAGALPTGVQVHGLQAGVEPRYNEAYRVRILRIIGVAHNTRSIDIAVASCHTLAIIPDSVLVLITDLAHGDVEFIIEHGETIPIALGAIFLSDGQVQVRKCPLVDEIVGSQYIFGDCVRA